MGNVLKKLYGFAEQSEVSVLWVSAMQSGEKWTTARRPISYVRYKPDTLLAPGEESWAEMESGMYMALVAISRNGTCCEDFYHQCNSLTVLYKQMLIILNFKYCSLSEVLPDITPTALLRPLYLRHSNQLYSTVHSEV